MYGYPLGAGRARGSLALWPFALRPARSTGKLGKAGAVHPAVYHPLEGPSVGRRGVKEFRAAEALALIAADRDHKRLGLSHLWLGNHRTEPEAWRPLVGPNYPNLQDL